jgi:hypothetical protein
MYEDIPVLGVGIGWRRELARHIERHATEIDWCEIISEHYLNVPNEKLQHVRALAERFTLVPHGIDLSIGTDLPIDDDYLAGLERLLDDVDAPWFSDHLCFTRVPGFNIGQLTPLPFTEETAKVVVSKVRALRSRIARPFALENITNAFAMPHSMMSESEFITTVLERADVGLLLDVCNVFINSQNYGYDPFRFIESLPLERVIQVHIAGGHRSNGQWHDSHSFPVHEEVFELLEQVVARAPVKGILLERDDNFPESFQELLYDMSRAREILEQRSPMKMAVS